MKLLKYLLGGALALGMIACGDDDDNGGDGPVSQTATLFEASEQAFTDAAGASATAQVVTITDRGEGTGTRTLSSDTTYVLDGRVFVNEGQTLTIEPGTVIKGAAGTLFDASALIVAPGGRINASGTADAPIIFTALSDNTFSTPDGVATTTNLDADDTGLWGGLIVLGRATLNTNPSTQAIEGIPSTETRGIFGGGDDDDDSGTIRYVSIRHGGIDIGGGNEINGLTMGGVGTGTTVEYVEVYANTDDGFEWFGGTVNSKYLVSARNQDDAFDYDMGWRGLNQHWLAFQQGSADRGGEHDGGTDPETGTPFATPTIANASYFGLGSDADQRAVTFRDNAGGHYRNSIFAGYANGIDVELTDDDINSYQRLVDGDLTFENNILFDIGESPFVVKGASDEITVSADQQQFADTYFANAGNTTASDPMFAADGVTPMTGGIATQGVGDNDDSFFDDVDYKGAVDPATGPTWIVGWTRLSQDL